MNCNNCGKEISSDQRVCEDCKKSIEQENKKKIILSPNNKKIKRNIYRIEGAALTLASIALATIICIIIQMYLMD